MKLKKTSIILLILLVFTGSTFSFAENNLLTEIEVQPGVYAYIDLTVKSGSTELLFTDGSTKFASYELSLTPTGEYIKFILEPSTTLLNGGFVANSSSGSYWIDEVIRVYPVGVIPQENIIHTENGPYGYAEGSLFYYAMGVYLNNNTKYEAWYRGWMVYGDITPTSIDY